MWYDNTSAMQEDTAQSYFSAYTLKAVQIIAVMYNAIPRLSILHNAWNKSLSQHEILLTKSLLY